MKLYRHLTANEWLQNLQLTLDQLPHTMIVHGEWEHEYNLIQWKKCLQQNQISPKWNTVVGKINGERIGYANVYGSAQATNIFHQFACAGTNTFLQTGYFGGLSRSLKYGTVLIVTAAKILDGVAHYYNKGSDEIRSSEKLIHKAIAYCIAHHIPYVTGKVVSVSSLLIEDELLVNEWIDEGYIGIDMETATTLAVAQSFGREAISFLNLSDLIVKDDSLYCYTEERATIEGKTDAFIKQLALHLATS